MGIHTESNVTWIDRPAFIEMAARMLMAGGDWSMILLELPHYARPRNKGKQARLSYHQGKQLMIMVNRRRKELEA